MNYNYNYNYDYNYNKILLHHLYKGSEIITLSCPFTGMPQLRAAVQLRTYFD